MRPILILAVAGSLLFQVGKARSEEPWKKIENEYFSFSGPPSLKKSDVRGIDSFVAEYVGDEFTIRFDYGAYSNNFSGWPADTKYEDAKIDGKVARIGNAKMSIREGHPYTTKVYIKLDKFTALSMNVSGKTEQDAAVAKKVFATLVFKPR